MINLTQREKRLLQLLGVILGAIVLLFMIVMPIIELKNRSDEKYKMNLANLSMLDKLYDDYREIDQELKRFDSLVKNTKGVASLIEDNAESESILKNKIYVRDRPSRVQGKYKMISTDVKFEGINIENLMKFIYKMENSNKLIKVSYLRISSTIKGKNTYDAQIMFDSFTE